MNEDTSVHLHLLRAEAGNVFMIYVRYCRFEFLAGYGRAILFAEDNLQILGGFRHRTNPEMTEYWAEPCDFGVRKIEKIGFGVFPEADWMGRTKPREAA